MYRSEDSYYICRRFVDLDLPAGWPFWKEWITLITYGFHCQNFSTNLGGWQLLSGVSLPWEGFVKMEFASAFLSQKKKQSKAQVAQA